MNIPIIQAADFDESVISRFPVASPGSGRRTKALKKQRYTDCICAFDIETSRLPDIEQSIMYIWQFQIDLMCTVIGRTWDEYRDFINRLQRAAPADLIVFIHNASYEWQFLKGIFEFSEKDIFAMDTRKVLKFKDGKIEYRCSWLQSNMNLAKFTETFGSEHAKLSGFDYEKIRYPWTELSPDELAYCVHDVQGLVEAMRNRMEKDRDTVYTLPLTSTGYVRREVRKSVQTFLPHDWIRGILPDLEVYDALLEAFRGGNTHANRYYSGEILHHVESWDRSSSYPDVQLNCRFPVSAFQRAERCDETALHDLIKRKKAVLFRVIFTDVRLQDPFYGCPYMSISKVRHAADVTEDNGRILSARQFECTLTDVDFRIMCDVYMWTNMCITDMWYARYGKLPKAITDPTRQFYVNKTALKGSKGDEYLYMKSKNMLNSVYGMSAQRPVRLPIRYDGLTLLEDKEADRQALLEKSNRHAFQSYAFGVWVTAWARLRLHEGIRIVGTDNFVYCDTDSVKYIDRPGIDWTAYNREREKDSLHSGAWADDMDGIRHFMGVYEHDGSYEQFKTLGAKKYCYVDKSGLHLTVAGVNKKLGAAELAEHGGIEAFKEGLVFRKAGGTESIYNDIAEPFEIQRDGHRLTITSNLVIKPSTYTLSITDDYRQILNDAYMYRKVMQDLKDTVLK